MLKVPFSYLLAPYDPNPATLTHEDPTAEPDIGKFTPVREVSLNSLKGPIGGVLVSAVPKGQILTSVNYIISKC